MVIEMGWLWLWPIGCFVAAGVLAVLKGKAGAAEHKPKNRVRIVRARV